MDMTRIDILPYPRSSSIPGSYILIDRLAPGAYDFKVFNDGQRENWLRVFNQFYEPEWGSGGWNRKSENRGQEIQQFEICPDSEESSERACCKDDEIIYALLHACFEGKVSVREVSYRGTVFTDVTDLRVHRFPFAENIEDDDYPQWEEYELHPIQFRAKRDGHAVTVCLLGPGFVQNLDPIETEGVPFPLYRIHGYTPMSNGMMVLDDGMMYLGAYECEWVEGGSGMPVHAFLRQDEESLTVSLLLNNRLYPKIRHSRNIAAFYYTPFDAKRLEAAGLTREELGRHPRDMVFWMKDGRYQYLPPSRDLLDAAGEEAGAAMEYNQIEFAAAADLVPPAVPGWESMAGSMELAHSLLPSYLRSLNVALSHADQYTHYGYAFTRCGEQPADSAQGMDPFSNPPQIFSSQVEGLTVTEEVTLQNCSVIPEGFDAPKSAAGGNSFRVNGCNFADSGIYVFLIPGQKDLTVRVMDPETGEQDGTSFSSLNKQGFFLGMELPKTIRFAPYLRSVLQNMRVYCGIRDAIVQYGTRKLHREVCHIMERLPKTGADGEMARRLYGENMTPDPNVVSFAMRMYNQFIRTGTVPNIALIGQAGTGKSTLAAKLGQAICQKDVILKSASDLQSEYVGGTNRVVIETLIEAARQDAILFIDEAYTLAESKSGQEAIAILLPLMAGTRSSAVTKFWVKSKGDVTVDVDFRMGTVTTTVSGSDEETEIEHIPACRGVPPIWIAGYEEDIRMMLARNQGLYRRFERITLPAPDTTTLFSALKKRLLGERDALQNRSFSELTLVQVAYNSNIDEAYIETMKNNLGSLMQQCLEYEEPIKKFFRWGSQPQNSKYFANYAGMERFLQHCLDGIDFTQPDRGIKAQMDGIIAATKRDIKHQLDTLRRGGSDASADEIEMIVDNKARFKDLVGCESQIGYMQHIIDCFKHKGYCDRFGITIPKGALLLGEPGVGKTFIARAMAGEMQEQFEKAAPDLRVGFMSLSAPEITTKPVSFIGRIFDKAEEYDVCVIFIDEVDAIAMNRFENPYYSHFIELIKQMDGVEQRANIFLLAATNVPESLDPAFTRAGRIDSKLRFELPKLKDLCELVLRSILKRCERVPGLVIEEDEDGSRYLADSYAEGIRNISHAIAVKMDGCRFTAQDVENLVNSAFLSFDRGKDDDGEGRTSAPKFGGYELDRLYRCLDEEVEKSLFGELRAMPENEVFSADKNGEDCSSTAIHEVGHALVHLLCGEKPFEKITCIPRARALGYVQPGDMPQITKADYEHNIRVFMGGRIAEEVVYGEDNISGGAVQDMREATSLARRMVEYLGFSDEFEFMVLQRSYGYSDAFRGRCDQEINAILKRLYQETKGMLMGKRELIITLAKEVFNRKTMTGEEFEAFYQTVKSVK